MTYFKPKLRDVTKSNKQRQTVGYPRKLCDNTRLIVFNDANMYLLRIILILFYTAYATTAQADVNTYFDQIQKDPDALYKFFAKMPKGGELHYHLAGGPSPEIMLSLVAQNDYCLNEKTLAISKKSSACDGVVTKNIRNQSNLYNKIIKSWSMEGFIPGQESGHDHFFNGFMKYMLVVINYRPQLIANVMKRAADQHEHYLEVMDIADNAKSTTFGDLIKDTSSYSKKKNRLLQNKDFQKNISHTVWESDHMVKRARKEIGCAKHSKKEACNIKIKFLYYILREQPLNNFFAQALNAFEAVSRSKGSLVGVNLVQPEDGTISLRDYHQQMLIFNYLHQVYPQVHISLHAGEITPAFAESKDLNDHIHDALFTGKAQRIGHGVDIINEDQAENTVQYMAQNHLPVEINLTSNHQILNVSGPNHPLNYYLSHQVPVVLSTDDEGVLRTDLTTQYVKAAIEYHLNYQTLKQINRNTLTYSFAPGQSIWANPEQQKRIPACQDLNAKTCIAFIETSEKAQLQWALERKLLVFEKNQAYKTENELASHFYIPKAPSP